MPNVQIKTDQHPLRLGLKETLGGEKFVVISMDYEGKTARVELATDRDFEIIQASQDGERNDDHTLPSIDEIGERRWKQAWRWRVALNELREKLGLSRYAP